MNARFITSVLAVVLLPSAVLAQTAPETSEPTSVTTSPFEAEWPFHVGETAVYDVTYGPVRVGRARLAIEALDTIRDIDAYRLALEVEGGTVFYKIDDRSVGWLATDPYRTVRYEEVLSQGGYQRNRRYDLDHESRTYTRHDWDEDSDAYVVHADEAAVPVPEFALDEVSFLFLVRTLPLEVGRTYQFENYFEEDGNPVVVEVLRRERVRVRAGTYETIVVRPIIQTDGLFSEGGEAEVYISDDERRTVVLIKSKLSIGQLNMYLRDIDHGNADETERR